MRSLARCGIALALGCGGTGAPCEAPLADWEGRGESPPRFDEAVADTLPMAGDDIDVYVYACEGGPLAIQQDVSWFASTTEYYDATSGALVGVAHASDVMRRCDPLHRSLAVEYGEVPSCERSCLRTASCGTDGCKERIASWERCGA